MTTGNHGPVAILAEYPSSSRPEVTYQVRIGDDGVTYCTCKAWVYQAGRPRVNAS